MTATAVSYITPLALTMSFGSLLIAFWLVLQETMPKRSQPVHFSNGTVQQLAVAIANSGPLTGKLVGYVDADGYIVIKGQKFMVNLKDHTGRHIYAVADVKEG